MSPRSKPEYFLADYRATCRSCETMYGPDHDTKAPLFGDKNLVTAYESFKKAAQCR